MKTIISILCSLSVTSMVFADVIPIDINQTHTGELGWVDEQIKAIIPSRVGIPDQEVNTLREPFKYLPDPSTITLGKYFSSKAQALKIAPKPPLVLNLIINSKALISGKWYQIGDSVNDYSVKSIETTSVTLANAKSVKILSIKSGSSNIKIKTK